MATFRKHFYLIASMNRRRAVIYFLVITIASVSVALLVTQRANNSQYNYLPLSEPLSLVTHNYYTLSYNEIHEQANWVFYKIDTSRLRSVAERTDRFRSDDSIITGSATNQDYTRSGYDRGHLAPAADMSFSKVAMDESFFYSNISPQLAGFNRGIWKVLEEHIRSEVADADSSYIFTGPVFKDDGNIIGPNKVSIPSGFYKIVIIFEGKRITPESWLIPHLENLKDLERYRVSIDSIEQQTGIDFFYKLPDRLEKRLEKKKY